MIRYAPLRGADLNDLCNLVNQLNREAIDAGGPPFQLYAVLSTGETWAAIVGREEAY